MQHSPQVTALVWAGIRGILQVRMMLMTLEIHMNGELTIHGGRFP